MLGVTESVAIDAKIIFATAGKENGMFIVNHSGWVLYLIYRNQCYQYAGWAAENQKGTSFAEHLISLEPSIFLNSLCGINSQEDIQKERILVTSAILKARLNGANKAICRNAYDFARLEPFFNVSKFIQHFPDLLTEDEIETSTVYMETDETCGIKKLFRSFIEQIKNMEE